MYKSKTTIMALLSLITTLAVIGVLVFFFVIIKHKNEHTSAVLTTLENKIQKKKNIHTLSDKIAEVEPIRSTLNSYFVNPGEIDSFVGYLENLGTESGAPVKVESVEISPLTKNTIIVQISSEGDFSNVLQALALLENAPYTITIQQSYINKRMQTVTETVKGVQKSKQVPIWHSDITFTLLSHS